MKLKIIIVLMFAVVHLFGKQKSYTLNYQPKGKIIKIIFGNCILYTDSTSLFNSAPALFNSEYYDKEKYDNVCKLMRTILKNYDTLLVDRQYDSETSGSLTVNGFDFELVAFKLIQNNKANIYLLDKKLYVKRVFIRTKKTGKLYDIFIIDKQIKNVLVAYYALPQVTAISAKHKRINLHGQKGKTYYTDTVKLSCNGVPLNKSELYFPSYIFYDNYDYPVYNGDSDKDKIKYKIKYKTFRALEKNKRFSETLALCGAPVFYTKPQTSKKLRILVIPTFSNPFCITIDSKDEPLLSIDVLSGKGGYSYGEPVTRLEKKITKQQADSLIGP